MWATNYISYNGDKQDTSTSISSSNVSSGTAGKISWTGNSCTYSSSRVNIAANGSITFTASSGYNITKIVITSGSSASYYGTWTSSPSVTPSSSSGVTTFDGLNANSVTVTTSTAFRCTSASNIKIYYEAASATALSVKTAPTKVNYKKGETLDLTGLVLDATVGGNHVDVTSGYTASPANGATLNSVGAQTVTFTYGGQNTTQTIHVGDLESIALTTTGVKTTYDEGQTFDPENLVVTATYSDGEDTPTTWTENVTASCTYDPDGALETTDDNVEVSYTFGSTTKTANISITVNAASAYTVTFEKGTGTCATSSLTEASPKAGVTLPTPTIGVTGWSFAGWAEASTTNTEVKPTLFAAGATYKPTEDCMLYAVYKFSDATTYKRATSVSDITSAGKVVIVCGSKVLDTTLGGSVTAPTESSSKITAPEEAIFTLTGDNTDGYTLTNSTTTIGTISTDNSTAISNTTTNDLWVVKDHGTANLFYFENKGKSNLCLEYHSGSWKVYAPSTPSSNDYVAMKVYVPVTVYNSNPAAIVNPTIAWTTDGDKTLYLKNTNSYDNAANVTGISKTPVYTSSDATVATVSEAGVVEALKKGTTTIKATVEAETGVNTKAEVSYVVTVKDASNVAGIKAITSTASVVTFTADLTDAVVTYVNGDHAFIQDVSGAVYASCGSSLTAGKKINGAVSGSVKAANKIDEITAIDITDATVTDGVIPSAVVITAATLAANKADYEGKLVSIEGATVTASLENGSASNGKISDDSKKTEINLYAPDKNIEVLKDAEGTFNGYITLYGDGSSIRFNIFEQSQITLTKNAPTAQSLTFASDAVELDEDTDDYDDFAGQAVSGAQGTVTYSIDSNDDGVVTSIDDKTGAVVLSGEYGTATIKASAAAKEVTEAGVTTPYTATTKTYTITVYPRYTVTFNVNGVVSALRQENHSAEIAVPSPSAIGDYVFKGWSTTTVAATNVAPSTTSVTNAPTANATYYAVFAREIPGDDEKVTSSLNLKQTEPSGSKTTVNGVDWSWSNVTFSATANTGMGKNQNATVTFKLPDNAIYASKIELNCPDMQWGGDAVVVLKAGTTTLESMKKGDSYTFTDDDKSEGTYTMSQTTSSNAWINSFDLTYYITTSTYKNYCTTVPSGGLSLGADTEDTENGYTYATFSADEPVVFTSDVEVFALEVNGDKLVKNELTTGDFLITDDSYESGTVEGGYYVPANTGVMLRSTSEKIAYYYPTTEQKAEDNPAVPTNLLIAGTGSTPDDSAHKYYKLTYKNALKENLGFYWGAADGAPFELKKGKAYLKVSKSSPARYFSLTDTEDGETTGISAALNDKGQMTNDKVVYNLNGQRVAQPAKGMYIVNGRKVIIK